MPSPSGSAVPPGKPSRLGRVVRAASTSVASQLITAGTSLVLQVIALRFLGATGFAAFALITAVLVTLTAVYTAWVGDSLTVLDRFDPAIRSALMTSILAFLLAGTAGAAGLAVVLDLAGPTGVLLFALLTPVWLIQETGRRLLSARLEFARLVGGDATYATVTLAVMAGGRLLTGELTLDLTLLAMNAGCLGSLAVILLRLPKDEYRLPRPRWSGMRALAGFAAWRSAQTGLRPLTLLVMRVAIDSFASRAALAAVEAARLLLTPALTVINGVGGFLLPTFVGHRQAGEPLRPRLSLVACLALTAGSAVCGLAAVLATAPLGGLLTGGDVPLDVVTVGGWAMYAVSFSATLPMALLATAYRLSRLVFLVRGLETAVGLTALLTVLAWRPDLVPYAPYCIGLGGIASSGFLWWRLRTVSRRPDSGADEAAPPVERGVHAN